MCIENILIKIAKSFCGDISRKIENILYICNPINIRQKTRKTCNKLKASIA